MAGLDGKGSIILKVIILLLIIVAIVVIIIPGQIWQEEETVKNVCRGNMSTLFEAHRYYFGLKGNYTDNEEELILTIQNDSTLLKRQIIVNHTNRLKNAMESFLSGPAIKNLYAITSNLKNIEDDLTLNERFFRAIEEINQEAENVKMKIASLRSGVQFENYLNVATNLDSLWQLRYNLTDHSLQSAARMASSLSSDITQHLPNIDFNAMNQIWQPLSIQISDLMSKVEASRLKSLTSVADRVADFQTATNQGYSYFLANQTGNSYVANAEDLANVYNEFLSDFLITQEYAQYALSETDSLLININERNFYTPREHLKYIFSKNDTAGIRIEDPILLTDLKSQTLNSVNNLKQIPFFAAFENYQNQIDSLKAHYQVIRTNYRRNFDVTITAKEIDAVIDEIPTSGAFEAYLKMKSFVDIVPQSDSYSEIKDEISSSLVSVGTFKQIYEDNFFGNLDTIHIELMDNLNHFNEILSKIRRNTFSVDDNINQLNTALSQIKSISKESVLPILQQVEENLTSTFFFASEGKEEPVYGVFATRVVNHGKIYGTTGRKSWEE